jgi:head-tail adaptor
MAPAAAGLKEADMADELTGTLTERVAIEHFVDSRDASGASTGNWQPAASAWAAIVPDGQGGSEGETRRSARRWRVMLRAPTPVGLLSRLIWRGEWLAVLAVEADPRTPDRVTLRCEARAH